MKNKKLFAILTLVCFMFTLMPVAAFAGGVADPEVSFFEAVDGDQTVRLNKVDGKEVAAGETEGVEFQFDILDAAGDRMGSHKDKLYVWAVNEAGNASSAMQVVGLTAGTHSYENVWNVTSLVATGAEKITIQFVRDGKYTVYAGYGADADLKDMVKFSCDFSTIEVKSASTDPDYYKAEVKYTDSLNNIDSTKVLPGVFYKNTSAKDEDGKPITVQKETVLNVVPNNVATDKVAVYFYDVDGKALKGANVAISTNSSAIEVNKETATTNNQGKIEFKVSASVEGTYEIDFVVDGVTWTLNVQVGNTAAAYIETAAEPTAPQALYSDLWNSAKTKTAVRFTITDINGNIVSDAATAGMDLTLANDNGKYIVLTEAPADTDLESEDLGLAYNSVDQQWYLTGVGTLDAEGTYAVKVILENGAYATAKWEVKKFQTPVMLVIGTSTDRIELGATISGELKYMDANGVMKNATDAELAATGYAVANVAGGQSFSITAKSDEKYVGAVITATAVSEKYDLVAVKEFTVADGAVAINFVDKAADVNVNNKLEWNIVDSTGTKVSLIGVVNPEVKYVVLDKPADAKVSVNDVTSISDLVDKGVGKLSLTSNKVGNVTVQVVVKAKALNATNNVAEQTKYYTGTQIIAVGTQGVGDVVVMSIGSNEIVINDAKATIDAAPIVENNRTFVPFRALAEAFGATVAYDEATQAVTAELNGVTVVMTIGSAEYTVNGEAKTADVAPFINGSRTMVPVRFAAEAFGIKVIPTYDENGATADILFNL